MTDELFIESPDDLAYEAWRDSLTDEQWEARRAGVLRPDLDPLPVVTGDLSDPIGDAHRARVEALAQAFREGR